MRCQARVEDTLQTFPNTKTVYHTTKQCEEIASRKYPVDNGDSEMLLCGGCFRRCLTKKNKGSSWLGFFDCSYPPEAKVKGSSWYYWMLSSSSSQETEDTEETEELCDEMAKCSLSDNEGEAEEKEQEQEQEEANIQEEVQEESVADKITARIASLKALAKNSRNMPVKEQAKILKEIINLRTQLKKNK